MNVTALHELVKGAHESGRLEEAERYLLAYLQYNPSDPHILFSLSGFSSRRENATGRWTPLDRLVFFDPSYDGAKEFAERIAFPVQGARGCLS